MFTIGDFARHGRVSVRMLRHYDAIGLLCPAHVDRASGYRYYEASQLSRLNRIVALKGLGFTLRQVRGILDEEIGTEQLRGMLRLRSAQLEESLAQTASILVQVEARLQSIEIEGAMHTEDVVIKQLPAVRLARLSATADSFGPDDLGPVVTGLFKELRQLVRSADVAAIGPDTVCFETPTDDENRIVVHAGLPVTPGTAENPHFEVVTLPAVDRAATIMHHGMAHGFLGTSQRLVRWVDTHGYRFDGHAREITLKTTDDSDRWVAELQAPITDA